MEYRSDFTIDLGGLELPDDVRKEIAQDIQKAVLSRLPFVDTRGDAFGVRFPNHGTDGIWIRPDLDPKVFGG